MDLSDFFAREIFTLWGFSITTGRIITIGLGFVLLMLSYLWVNRRWLPRYFQKEEVPEEKQGRIRWNIQLSYLLFTVIILLQASGIDYPIFAYGEGDAARSFNTSTIFQALLIFQMAQLFDWIFSEVLVHRYVVHQREDKKDGEDLTANPPRQLVQPIMYILAILLILDQLDIHYHLFTAFGKSITISNLLVAFLILFTTRLLAWVVTQLVLISYYQKREINVGTRYAINQLLKYVFYVFAILLALEFMDIKLSIVLGGAAALLVGVGLGLQQTFNDLVCGIILLFERSVEVGDILQMDDMVGRVKKIGVRTSLIETLNNITVIVPNSQLVADKVINWSHFRNRVRYKVEIGVAYGSDTQLVKELLLQVADQHAKVMRRPAPFVRFADFGDSALNFELFFWSREMTAIDDVKSDMRFEIDRLFRENKIEIPFPQRDVWIRKE
ncbi:MAG: mechanosensitive ion channel [Saprospiraceae bacterium]|nr:mechanosensitive ion channel [Saprospiraceae bacterium]